MITRRFASLLCFLCLLPVTQARAAPENITAGELALTPAFCQDVQTINGWSQFSNPSPRSAHWVSLMGMTFWGMHHYCWALVNLQRAHAAGTPPRIRAWRIRDAIDDFNFVVHFSYKEKGFVLLPEVLYRIGEAYVLLEEYGPAIDHFGQARAVKPDYWPPYISEAKIMAKGGRIKEAVEFLEAALALMPDEPNLKAALKDLQSVKPRAGRTSTPTPSSARPK